MKALTSITSSALLAIVVRLDWFNKLGSNLILQVDVFWAVKQCSDEVRYHHFGRTRCLHLQGEGGSMALRNVTSQKTST
jgi:hypothetical protein